MLLLLGGRRRLPRAVLIAAAVVVALAACFHCRREHRYHFTDGGGTSMSAEELDLEQQPFDRKRDSDTRLLVTAAALSGTKQPLTGGTLVKNHTEGGQRQRAILANTFFSSMKCRFSKLMVNSSDDIRTEQFLKCCSELSEFFDLLGTAAFKAVKTALARYIRAINESYQASPKASRTLQGLVLSEQFSGVATDTTTCCNVTPTEAVLWLLRGLEFIAEFLTELKVQSDLSSAGQAAYDRCLKPYHGLLLRAAFSVGLRMAPYRDTFLTALASASASDDSTDKEHERLTPELEKALFDEMHDDVIALRRCFAIIKVLYKSHNLDWEAVA